MSIPIDTRRYVSPRVIRRHWAPLLWERKGYDSVAEFLEPGVCFACGCCGAGNKEGNLERAHIVPRCEGGSDAVENLHLLCSPCHQDSEWLKGDGYWRWFWERTMLDGLLSLAMRLGLNPWTTIQSCQQEARRNRKEATHVDSDRHKAG